MQIFVFRILLIGKKIAKECKDFFQKLYYPSNKQHHIKNDQGYGIASKSDCKTIFKSWCPLSRKFT